MDRTKSRSMGTDRYMEIQAPEESGAYMARII